MTREQAMKLMTETAFQEEREAAGKWVRAQLTSAQLSTYFVGYQEHFDMRAAAKRSEGEQVQPARRITTACCRTARRRCASCAQSLLDEPIR